MKKVILVCAVATAVVCYGVGVLKSELTLTDLVLSDVESIAACESIGWWNNNGNCVKNDKDVYFCKSDSWPALTDCLQQYSGSYQWNNEEYDLFYDYDIFHYSFVYKSTLK